MNIFALSGFINGVSGIVFGSFIYFKNPKKLLNRTFGLMTLFFALWSFSYGFWMISQEKTEALFWVRMLSLGSIFIPITFLHWILTLLEVQESKKKILLLGYLLTILLSVFSFTSLCVRDVGHRLSFFWWPQAGIVYTLYIIFCYVGMIGYGSFELIKAYRKAKGDKKQQIKYVLLAIAIGFTGGATNFPLWYGIPIIPVGNFLVFLYPFILTLAITKYHLFDIKIIFTEILIGVIGVILLVQAFFSENSQFKIVQLGIFVLFCLFGYLLIKTMHQELERKEELQRAYEELKKLDIAKSEFIAMASHQLRTPLSIIKGYISMILDGTYGEFPKDLEKPLNNVFGSNERLIRIVNDLLNISKVELGKMDLVKQETQIEDLIEGVLQELEIETKRKNLYLKWKRPKRSLPKIEIDSLKIRQVIYCVVDNAIKYTEKGGIKLWAKKQDSKIQIVVSDTGAGMTKQDANRIFSSFVRGKAGLALWAKGVGLGLYLSKKYMELHNGEIWVKSLGRSKGSTFYIVLPI